MSTGTQIGFSGDDLFNMHTTLMVVLKCESTTSCLIVNPHLSDPSRRNTVYGSNSVMEMLVPVSKLRSSSCSRAELSVRRVSCCDY